MWKLINYYKKNSNCQKIFFVKNFEVLKKQKVINIVWRYLYFKSSIVFAIIFSKISNQLLKEAKSTNFRFKIFLDIKVINKYNIIKNPDLIKRLKKNQANIFK